MLRPAMVVALVILAVLAALIGALLGKDFERGLAALEEAVAAARP